jgi:predicted RNA-binding Zn-ribbon protein involved in translation (DUF1610 family)
MFSWLRVPERLFAMAMWVVSIVFASFLIGLGGKIVGELPGVDATVSMRDFVDPAKAAPLRARQDSLNREQRRIQDAHARATQELAGARNAYAAQRQQFEAWIATRTATTDPQQDPEVLRRTRQLDSLKTLERDAERVVEQYDAALIAVSQAREANREQEMELEIAARGPFEKARFRQELTTFGIRLALTLPLLLIAGWLVARKRRSEYWPLLRGFVLFAVFAFFVELVPYLPSYGGYVRYGVGIVASGVAGVWIIRAMRRYLARRQEVEQQSEGERRRAMSYENAVKRIDSGVCPGCERAITKGAHGASNFCVHCGMRLFDACKACTTRKNAFYPYCPDCGSPTAEMSEVSYETAT